LTYALFRFEADDRCKIAPFCQEAISDSLAQDAGRVKAFPTAEVTFGRNGFEDGAEKAAIRTRRAVSLLADTTLWKNWPRNLDGPPRAFSERPKEALAAGEFHKAESFPKRLEVEGATPNADWAAPEIGAAAPAPAEKPRDAGMAPAGVGPAKRVSSSPALDEEKAPAASQATVSATTAPAEKMK